MNSPLLIQVDVCGHPPTPLGPPQLSVSIFQFHKLQHSLLFLAVFRVLNFRSCFEALNNVFFGEIWEQHGSMDRCFSSQSYSSQIDISNELLYVSNGDRVPKLRPREVDVPIYPKRGPQFGVSSFRVSFLDVQGFPLFLNNKQAFEPYCNIVQRHVAATSLLRDKLPSPQLVYFHFCL